LAYTDRIESPGCMAGHKHQSTCRSCTRYSCCRIDCSRYRSCTLHHTLRTQADRWPPSSIDGWIGCDGCDGMGWWQFESVSIWMQGPIAASIDTYDCLANTDECRHCRSTESR